MLHVVFNPVFNIIIPVFMYVSNKRAMYPVYLKVGHSNNLNIYTICNDKYSQVMNVISIHFADLSYNYFRYEKTSK